MRRFKDGTGPCCYSNGMDTESPWDWTDRRTDWRWDSEGLHTLAICMGETFDQTPDRQTHLRLAHTHRVWWGQSTIVGRLGASDARPATSTPGCRTPQATAGNRQHVCPSRQHGSFALLSESQGPAKQQPSVSWLPGPRAELPGVCLCVLCVLQGCETFGCVRGGRCAWACLML